MARSSLTVIPITRAGVTPTLAAANVDGNSFANDGRVFLHVKNGSAGSINVTIQTPGLVDGLAVADLVVAVPATSGEKEIGPFPPGIYNQSDGSVYVDYSAVATVTVQVRSLP